MNCNHPNCQFSNRLNNDIYFYTEESGDTKCMFHISKEYKEKYFKIIDKQRFETLLVNYLFDCIKNNININLSNVIFIQTDVFKNKDYKNLILDFTNAEFIGRINFDNIKCKELKLQDCKFYDGGRIKSRDKYISLEIESLIFDPYLLKSDFIIDLGQYVNENGLVETEIIGKIKRIKFSNPQLEDGKVFFVGLNEYLEEGDFTNRFLDNVIFHNCDLSKCRFMNSKVINTTFLNVQFNFIDNYSKYMIHYDNKYLFFIQNIKNIFIIGVVIFLSFLIAFFFFKGENDYIYILIIIFTILIIFGIGLNVLFDKILYIITAFMDSIATKHIYTYDERKLFEELKNNNITKTNVKSFHQSYKNLQNLYEELMLNFKNNDYSLHSEFTYSMKYINLILNHKFIIDLPTMNLHSLHNMVNGFGQRWIRPLVWFISTILIFSFIFMKELIPNKDYISTHNIPVYLLKVNKQKDNVAYKLYENNFSIVLWKKDNINNFDNNTTFYGYDGRYNFNGKKQQKILALKNDFKVGFYKSISNLFYPFTPESKKWFQNITQPAVIASFIETFLLWIFMLAFFRALWNKIKV